METISLEFLSDTKEHLKTFEHQLKQIHGVHVDLVEPRDSSAPALVGVSIDGSVPEAAQHVSQTLSSFIREEQSVQRQKKIYLVTIEGDRVDLENLAVEDIYKIIVTAQQGQ
ncbi:MAG: hypothetical protein PVS3B3_12970 [Ktedonobacteraceae bacterium]